MEKKYIICDYARANWGKTETLLEVISLLKGKPQNTLINEKPNTGKDKWCHFEMKGKPVVISTLGDPNSAQPVWLEDAAKAGAKIIVTASRTSGFPPLMQCMISQQDMDMRLFGFKTSTLTTLDQINPILQLI